MLKIPDSQVKTFSDAVMDHKVNISAMNVYYQNIRMINGRHDYIDRDTYDKVFNEYLSDIEIVSSPIDSFVPCDDTVDKLFLVNELMPEYVAISERLTEDVLKEMLGNTHPAIVALVNNECKIETLHDDIYIYYCLFKYITLIDLIKIKSYSYMKPIIEWIVNSVSLEDIKSFIHTKKINDKKYVDNFQDLLFNPDFMVTYKFYQSISNNGNTLDISTLLKTLASNIVLKTDVYWIIGIYMVCSFAMFDKDTPDSLCVKYVNEVISKVL